MPEPWPVPIAKSGALVHEKGSDVGTVLPSDEIDLWRMHVSNPVAADQPAPGAPGSAVFERLLKERIIWLLTAC